MAKWKFKKVAKLDDVPEAYRSVYVEKDGGFVVDPAKLEELEIDDKAELAGALENERKETKRLKGEVTKYQGIDPDRAREAQRKLDELEAKELMDKGEFDRLLKKRSDEFDAREADYRTQLADRDARLEHFELITPVKAAALAAGVLPEDLDDVVDINKKRFRREEGKIVILDKDGDPTTSTLEKFWGEEFKTQKPKFYGASGAGGSGAPAGGTGGGTGGARTVSGSDQAALSANLEGIASGEVTVT